MMTRSALISSKRNSTLKPAATREVGELMAKKAIEHQKETGETYVNMAKMREIAEAELYGKSD